MNIDEDDPNSVTLCLFCIVELLKHSCVISSTLNQADAFGLHVCFVLECMEDGL